MQRRDLLKGVAIATVAGTVESAKAQAPEGPYSLPTERFNKANQHVLPNWAFKKELQVPLVPRPTAIGTFQELTQHGARPFGPGDSSRIGECFHGIAREWGETPPHWAKYGCQPKVHKDGWDAWLDKVNHFGTFKSHEDPTKRISNWGGGGGTSLPIKCYKVPMVEHYVKLFPPSAFDTRVYAYAGMVPGPTLKMRLGQPVVVRYENHLETETSIHLHGGHSPSHSDGFPSFYVLQGKARDYFYPNILPLYEKDGKHVPDIGEAQSTMWYHDHAMDATAYNASKGLSGFAPCFGEEELKLIRDGVLPGLREKSCIDPEQNGFVYLKGPDGKILKDKDGNPMLDFSLEHPNHPGFYDDEFGKEPYYNPYDIPLVLQDRVFDEATGQIAYDNTGHNGYIGETMLVNGIAWPYKLVERRKYRFRILDGSNARVYRLRIMSAADFYEANEKGIDAVGQAEDEAAAVAARPNRYDDVSKTFLRIGKDSWLWSEALSRKSMVLMMANRADIVVDFEALRKTLKPGEPAEFFLVNTMPQFDGRGPKAKLDDGGDPRVLPLPFDVVGLADVPDVQLVETNRPIALLKFIVKPDELDPARPDATVEHGTPLRCDAVRDTPGEPKHRPIPDSEIQAVREFIFHRGKGAWKINGRFYDPTIANAGPILDGAEEWVLRNGGGGWWHPIHIHLESHQLISYEKDFAADAIIDRQDPPAPVALEKLKNLFNAIPEPERLGLHDTQALGPNTVARIRMRHRTWSGPFVFHCHNLEHEDMRMMFNFEPVPQPTPSIDPADKLPNIAPTARTHGDDVTYQGLPEVDDEGKIILYDDLGNVVPKDGKPKFKHRCGELPWEYPPIPQTPVQDSSEDLIPARPKSIP